MKPFLFALLCVIWGSTWLVIKVGYGNLGPFTIAAVRFLVAGVILVPLVWLFRARWPRGRTEWLLVVWVGVVLFGADYGLVYWGEQWLDSGLTAIIFASLPVMTSVAAHFYLRAERLTAQTLLGTILAFLGVVALFADRLAVDRSQVGPMLAILASAACATAANLAIKRYGSTLHPVALNAPSVLIGGTVLFLVARVAGEQIQFPTDTETWSAVLYLAVVGSVFTFLVYFWLLKTWSVTTLSFIAVFTPLVAVLLGFLFREERPTAWSALGGVLILGGATLALWRDAKTET